jgi:hypothetical protein
MMLSDNDQTDLHQKMEKISVDYVQLMKNQGKYYLTHAGKKDQEDLVNKLVEYGKNHRLMDL